MPDEKKKNESPTQIVTGVCRLSYANLWSPKSVQGGKPKYSCSVIIPKSDTLTINKIKKAIAAAYEEGKGILQGSAKAAPPLASVKTPLRDGDVDRPNDEAYQNAYFVNANSLTQPGIVDKSREEILDHAEIYSGVYARVQLSFYAFKMDVNSGIACGLQNIQKIRDGEPLGGRMRAEDAFDDDFQDEDGYLD